MAIGPKWPFFPRTRNCCFKVPFLPPLIPKFYVMTNKINRRISIGTPQVILALQTNGSWKYRALSPSPPHWGATQSLCPQTDSVSIPRYFVCSRTISRSPTAGRSDTFLALRRPADTIGNAAARLASRVKGRLANCNVNHLLSSLSVRQCVKWITKSPRAHVG